MYTEKAAAAFDEFNRRVCLRRGAATAGTNNDVTVTGGNVNSANCLTKQALQAHEAGATECGEANAAASHNDLYNPDLPGRFPEPTHKSCTTAVATASGSSGSSNTSEQSFTTNATISGSSVTARHSPKSLAAAPGSSVKNGHQTTDINSPQLLTHAKHLVEDLEKADRKLMSTMQSKSYQATSASTPLMVPQQPVQSARQAQSDSVMPAPDQRAAAQDKAQDLAMQRQMMAQLHFLAQQHGGFDRIPLRTVTCLPPHHRQLLHQTVEAHRARAAEQHARAQQQRPLATLHSVTEPEALHAQGPAFASDVTHRSFTKHTDESVARVEAPIALDATTQSKSTVVTNNILSFTSQPVTQPLSQPAQVSAPADQKMAKVEVSDGKNFDGASLREKDTELVMELAQVSKEQAVKGLTEENAPEIKNGSDFMARIDRAMQRLQEDATDCEVAGNVNECDDVMEVWLAEVKQRLNKQATDRDSALHKVHTAGKGATDGKAVGKKDTLAFLRPSKLPQSHRPLYFMAHNAQQKPAAGDPEGVGGKKDDFHKGTVMMTPEPAMNEDNIVKATPESLGELEAQYNKNVAEVKAAISDDAVIMQKRSIGNVLMEPVEETLIRKGAIKALECEGRRLRAAIRARKTGVEIGTADIEAEKAAMEAIKARKIPAVNEQITTGKDAAAAKKRPEVVKIETRPVTKRILSDWAEMKARKEKSAAGVKHDPLAFLRPSNHHQTPVTVKKPIWAMKFIEGETGRVEDRSTTTVIKTQPDIVFKPAEVGALGQKASAAGMIDDLDFLGPMDHQQKSVVDTTAVEGKPAGAEVDESTVKVTKSVNGTPADEDRVKDESMATENGSDEESSDSEWERVDAGEVDEYMVVGRESKKAGGFLPFFRRG